MVDINLIPREYREKKEKFSGIFSKTVIGVFALVILSLLVYGGLLFYKNKLNNDLENIDQATKDLESKRDSEVEEEMIKLDEKLRVLKGMFENHLYWSKLFKEIEILTVPEVYFADANFNLVSDELGFNFSGNALSYTILARQVLSFQESDYIKDVFVSDITLSEEGGISFNLLINFSKDVVIGLELEND